MNNGFNCPPESLGRLDLVEEKKENEMELITNLRAKNIRAETLRSSEYLHEITKALDMRIANAASKGKFKVEVNYIVSDKFYKECIERLYKSAGFTVTDVLDSSNGENDYWEITQLIEW